MSSDLLLPQVPEAKPEDPEDVSWALSTAEAMWARGDHAEGLKWVRRAAEAAAEADADARALELAKAAADLASVTKQLTTTPTPRAPLAPRVPQAKGLSRPPEAPKAASSARSVLETVKLSALDEHAGARLFPPEAPAPASGHAPAGQLGFHTDADLPDPTIVGNVNELARRARDSAAEWDLVPTRSVSAAELDLAADPGARMTVLGQPPPSARATPAPRPEADASAGPPTQSGAALSAWSQPSPASSHAEGARATLEPHDPGLETTQAVRVVVWRDASGVHVAPAGTVVSAITVDAVLVALEPRTDLTAWLTRKQR